jgi:hypothetical protein
MAINHMKEVANLLGVELEEEFRIKDFEEYVYKFGDMHLVFKADGRKEWFETCLLEDLLNGTYEIEKTILTDKEKEYLSYVIKPFKDRVFGIAKQDQYVNGYEYITIMVKEENGDHFHMGLPSFKVGTMYKGMELNKEYTLEELGL